MRHRADIEGLRALAILLVVAAHADIPGFSGGYAGVDIFFVLSGYLITGLLVQERLKTGKLEFVRFYARRFRRLLPALLLMLAVSAWLGWQLLPAGDQVNQAAAGAAAAAWVSNIYFAFSKVGYFEPGAEVSLYLHTWSLAVEEQFYLVWPALIMLAVAGASAVSLRHRLVVAMAVVAVASLLLELWAMQRSAIHAFYLMPMRAWEFALGALVYLSVKPLDTMRARYGPSIVAAAGLALIVAALIWLDESVSYPGAWALLPSIGAALLIAAGVRQPANLPAQILSLRPMQWLGRVSYSWYLWHWPVLILGAAVIPSHGMHHRFLFVAVSLAFAMFSYRFVESPIRRNDALLARPGWVVTGSLALMMLTLVGNMSWGNAAHANAQNVASRYRAQLPQIYHIGCDDWYSSDALRICEFGNPQAERVGVVMGDSIGLQWFPAFERIFAAPQWRLLVVTKSSCPMVDRPIYYARIGREYTECAAWRERAKQFIVELKPEVLILGSTHTAEFRPEDWVGGTRSLLAVLSPHVGNIAVIRSTPHLPFDGKRCLDSRVAGRLSQTESEDLCTAVPDKRKSDLVAGWIIQAAQGLPNVRIVDMDDEVCPEGICHAAIGGQLVYRDTQHLNAGFVAQMAGKLAERIGFEGMVHDDKGDTQ